MSHVAMCLRQELDRGWLVVSESREGGEGDPEMLVTPRAALGAD